MRLLSLNEMKQIQLNILNHVADFCEKNNIKYFLMGGTLLGAVRHQGYIPWDDDIDIGMLREDYDRFISLYQSDNFYLYGYEVNKNSSFPFIKVCMKNTLMKEGLDETFGINIDLFPIDSVSSKYPKLICKTINRILCLRHLKVSTSFSDKSFLKRNIKNILSKILNYTNFDFIFGLLFFTIKRQKFNPTKLKGNLVWGYGERELVNPNIFNNLIQLNFEGSLYYAPEKYDEWLKNVYGYDYMQIPSKDKQVSHHNFQAFL